MNARLSLTKHSLLLAGLTAAALLVGTSSSALATNVCSGQTITSPSTLPTAAIGSSYSYTLTSSATTSCPDLWFIVGRLPSGLHLNYSTGVISGTTGNYVETASFQVLLIGPGSFDTEWVTLPVTDTVTVDPTAGQLTGEATDGHSVYVADGGSNAVFQLSGSNPPAVLTPPSLSGLDFPEYPAAAGGDVFAVNFYATANTISSTAPSNPTISVPGCSNAADIAAAPAGPLVPPQIVVTCFGSGNVFSLSEVASTYQPISTYSFGPSSLPSGVANVAGNDFLVGDDSNSTVTLLSFPTSGALQPATVLATVSLPSGSYPASIAYDPFDSTAYVANAAANTVSALKVAFSQQSGTWTLTDEGETSVGTGPFGLAVNPSTSTLVVANAYDDNADVLSLRSSTPKILYQVSVGRLPSSVAIVGSLAYVDNGKDGTVSVIDASASPFGPFRGFFGHPWDDSHSGPPNWNPLIPPNH